MVDWSLPYTTTIDCTPTTRQRLAHTEHAHYHAAHYGIYVCNYNIRSDIFATDKLLFVLNVYSMVSEGSHKLYHLLHVCMYLLRCCLKAPIIICNVARVNTSVWITIHRETAWLNSLSPVEMVLGTPNGSWQMMLARLNVCPSICYLMRYSTP